MHIAMEYLFSLLQFLDASVSAGVPVPFQMHDGNDRGTTASQTQLWYSDC